MTRAPGSARTPDGNLTDLRPKAKRDRRAEADRHRMTRTPLHRRMAELMRASGLEPEAWQVESLVVSLVANAEQPTDEHLMLELMAAPWCPKPRPRRWQVGELGWRTQT